MSSITRRDFLNGAALTIAAGLTPAAQIAAQPARYPPTWTGLRGQHDGSFEIAHAFARERRKFPIDGLPIDETYDLVVVGGGISGLSAAWFYRRARPSARILILDNHDDFGGHAKRNEFALDGRRIIGYGGSQSLQSPNSLYSPVAKGLLRDLGVDITRFETAFERNLYPSLGLSRGMFFNREAFGRDALVVGDPGGDSEDADRRSGKSVAEFVSEFPISQESKAQLVALYAGRNDPLAGKSVSEKRDILKRTSYRDYLTKICGCSAEVADCFQGRPLGFFGLGSDAVPAAEARDLGYPGFAGLKLPGGTNAAWKEPYIYHFPDGNASVVRLLVRALVPGVAPGNTMEDVVPAAFDYGALDRDDRPVRIRLDSTCVHVAQSGGNAQVAYVRDGRVRRVESRHVVLACFHMMIPHIVPQLPALQREALSGNVKTPICYTNVLVRNWRAFENLKVNSISAPMGFHHQVSLDFPVSLGGYRHPRDPSEPMLLHLVHAPGAPNQGLDARAQFRIGQGKLYAMTFADFEERIRDDLDRMVGPGGFSSARDIAAITVNRWPHGYSYVANSLFDPDDYDDTVLKLARQPFGPVAIANTDAGGDAWVHFAIDQADRAVRELVG
jgi:spermidine dehydrogenase